MPQPTLNIKNKRAFFEYEVLDKYTAGMVLRGSEIKSLREGEASIKEAYCYINKGEIFIKGMHIAEFKQASYNNHEPLRERKLLLNKREIKKISDKLKVQGLSLVPTKVFINSKGFAKIDIFIGKGKKLYDKRNTNKDRDNKRELDRITKNNRT